MKISKEVGVSLGFTLLPFLISLPAFPLDVQGSDELTRSILWSKNQFILTTGRLTPGNDFIDRYSDSFDSAVDCGLTNTITRTGGVDIDYESTSCSVYLEHSIKNVRFSVNSGFIRTGGGIFDSSIETFHELFDFPNGERGRTEENRFSVEGESGNGEKYNISRSDYDIVDPQISLSILLFEAEENKIFLDLSSTVPLAAGKFSLSSPELKLNLIYERRIADHSGFLFGLSSISHLDSHLNSISYENFSYGAFASFQYQVFENVGLLVQSVIAKSIYKDLPEFSDYEIYLDTGVRFHAFDSNILELILRENPSPGDGTADVSLFLRYLF